MAGAKIGALNVSLGIDSAQFSAGLKNAQSGLASFGKVAAVGFAAAAAAAVAAGAALAIAGKRAIDSADNMSKAAQKAGVATEALSRLNYAASYSDVSLEQLSGGLQKLSRNLADVASGTGGAAATALEALGIKATETNGSLRASDEVFAEIAGKFARMEDGSTKTALAIQLFGRAGAELIPLLNSGSAGLSAMADESDRLGLTISGKTGRAAEQFNDTLAKVGRIVDGVAMKVAEAALPALQSLADTLASPEVATAAATLGTALVGAFDAVVKAVVSTTNAVQGFLDWLNGMGGGASRPLANDLLAGDKANLADSIKMMSANPGYLSNLYAGMDTNADGTLKVQAPTPTKDFQVPNFTDAGAASAMASRLDALRQSLMTEEQLEIDSHTKRLEELRTFYENGAILKGEYDTLLEAAQQQHADRMSEITRKQVEAEARIREQVIGNVASIFGSLSQLASAFGEKNLVAAKAFGVAEAVVNTAQGITKALAQGGMLGFAGAAAVAAAGAAQIATILTASPGSSSTPSVSGTGGGVTATPAAETAKPAVMLELHGSAETPTTMGAVKSLLDQLQEELGSAGKQLVVTYKGS